MRDYTVRTADQLSVLLRGLRRARKLTQAEVALRLGVTQQTYSALERHASAIGTGRLLQVLAVLGADFVLRERPDPGAPAGVDHPTPIW